MSRSGYLLAVIALTLACSAARKAPAQPVTDTLQHLDGVSAEVERSAATHAILTDEGSFFVQRMDRFLRVTVESEPIGVASLCIGNGDNIFVLHASAALGSLRFRTSEDGWVTDGRFTWEMRESSMSDEAIAERTKYLESHSWIATTSSMGDPRIAEFLVSAELTGTDDIRIAVGIMPSGRPDVTLAFPTSAAACADDSLVRGVQPGAALHFAPSEWLNMNE